MNKISTVEAVKALLENELHFSVDLDCDKATSVLSGFRPYNFIPANIAELPAKLKKMIGPVDFGTINGVPNPNNGRFNHITVAIGNESSLCIYLKVRPSYNKKGLTPFRVMSDLKTIGAIFEADKNDDVQCTENLVVQRLWWD